jgi:sugar O-acyltransferase (sialic acid O-acetyltransferase NeuD family)
MNELYIFGEGGLGREVFDDISNNSSSIKAFKLNGYVIDEGEPKLSLTKKINEISPSSSILIAIGDSKKRKLIYERLIKLGFTKFPNYVSKDAKLSMSVSLGKGNIVLGGTILTVDIQLGDFNLINIACTVGHDVLIQDFVTLSPRVSISGDCKVQSLSFLGTGATLLPKVTIEENVIVGAGSVVLKKCEKNCTYVGVPAMKIG